MKPQEKVARKPISRKSCFASVDHENQINALDFNPPKSFRNGNSTGNFDSHLQSTNTQKSFFNTTNQTPKRQAKKASINYNFKQNYHTKNSSENNVKNEPKKSILQKIRNSESSSSERSVDKQNFDEQFFSKNTLSPEKTRKNYVGNSQSKISKMSYKKLHTHTMETPKMNNYNKNEIEVLKANQTNEDGKELSIKSKIEDYLQEFIVPKNSEKNLNNAYFEESNFCDGKNTERLGTNPK